MQHTCILDLMASNGKENIHRAQPPSPPEMSVLKESVEVKGTELQSRSNTATVACTVYHNHGTKKRYINVSYTRYLNTEESNSWWLKTSG